MKIIDYTEKNLTNAFDKTEYLNTFYGNEKILFFDIETTGFSAKNTTLYLIGALWFENGEIKIRQWFNKSGSAEEALIHSFELFCQNFTMLVHFNGLQFDLPYLKQKAIFHKNDFTVDTSLSQLDILKLIRPFKTILHIDNLKLTTIEQYLGIERKDCYTGGELIKVYQHFIANPTQEKEHLLLLHNHDDLLGMLKIIDILHYKAFFSQISSKDLYIQNISLNENADKLILQFQLPQYAKPPVRISCSQNGIYINAFEQNARIELPVIHDTLKHFFSDYKNYYYLPEEDVAIHKNIAAYVESANRKKATKNTCYVKRTGAFVPCFFKDNKESFQYDITSSSLLMELDSLLNQDTPAKINYILECLNTFLS